MPIRLATLRLFLFAFAALFWLSPQDPGNAQVITRVALALSIVEGGVSIDKYADRTIDKAEVDGHFYADKVPGHSLLAVPAVAVVHTLMPGDTRTREHFDRFVLAATVTVNALLSAIAVAVLFRLALLLGAPPGAAFFAGFTLAFATPFFGWSTAFFAHTVTASFLTLAFALIAVGNLAQGRLSRWPFRLGLLVGLILGYTLVVDLTAAPIVAMAGLVCVGLALRHGPQTAMRTAIGGIVGGVIGLLPLVVYNQIAFGSPFKLGYSSVVGFEGMQQGFFGLTVPNPWVALQLLFGPYRGLLPFSPILILVPFGLMTMWRRSPATRTAAGIMIVAFLAQLAINSSYFYWNGGWSTGPRHLVPILPFLALPLAFAWPQQRRQRIVVLVLLAVSVFISLVCASTDMFVREEHLVPFFDYILPNFWEPGRLLRTVPVLIIMGVLAWVWWRLGRGNPVSSSEP